MAKGNDCKALIQKAFGISKAEADEIVVRLEDILERNAGSDRPSIAVKRAAQQAAEQLREDAPHLAANARRKLLQRKKDSARIDAAPNKFDEIEGRGVGSNTGLDESRLSVDTHQIATKKEFIGGMLNDMADADHRNIIKLFTKKPFGRDVAKEMMSGEAKSVTGNADAFHFAQVAEKWKDALLVRANKAGAMIGKLPGHVMSQVHNAMKLKKAGKEAWIKFILPLLDHQKTFGESDPAQYLSRVFDNIVTGRGAEGGGEGLAGRISRHRQLHFKDADSFLPYNDKFGDRDVVSGIFNGMVRLSEQTALIERMTPDPEAHFDWLIKKYGEALVEEGGPSSKIMRFGRGPIPALRNRFHALTGADSIPASPVMAYWAQGLRNLQNTALMGRVLFSSLPDVATRGANAHLNGIGYLSGYANLFGEFAKGPITAARKEQFRQLGFFFDGILNDTAARMNAADGPPGMLSGWANKMFKWNLLNWWTDRMEAGHAFMLSNNLARHADKPLADIPEGLQKRLALYGIGEKEWKSLAAAKATFEDGAELLTPDGVRALDKFKGQPALEQKLRSYFVGEVNTAVPRPGAREHAIVLQGTQAGTPEGEALRMAMQFKMFSVTMLTKVWPSIMRDGMPGFLHLAAMMTLFGYGAMTAKDLASGRKPRDPLDPKTWVEAMTHGGGMGIIGDVLLNDFSEYGRSFPEVLAGPGIGAVGDVARIATGVVQGKDKSAAAFRVAMSNMPFSNLFYTRPAIDYLWTYQMQELMNPGYLRRMERRVKSGGRRDFLVKPSDIIQRGGGFR